MQKEKRIFVMLFILLFIISCKTKSEVITVVKKQNYELKISNNQSAVLILFPCFPCDIENTKNEANFLKNIEKDGVTTLLLDFNQKLYLTNKEKIEYAKIINSILDKNKIKKENIFIGGFSSGGNISIILSNFLLKTKDIIQPTGAFAVDSPLDLEELYNGAKKDIEKNISEDAVNEGFFLVELLEKEIGKPNENIEKYEEFSPYLMSSNSTTNIEFLNTIKIRLYCEPDLEWQQKNRSRKYEDLNAYKLEKTYNSLLNLGSNTVEFVKTENKGVRANGEKHPHSWNIVERESLLKWMME